MGPVLPDDIGTNVHSYRTVYQRPTGQIEPSFRLCVSSLSMLFSDVLMIANLDYKYQHYITILEYMYPYTNIYIHFPKYSIKYAIYDFITPFYVFKLTRSEPIRFLHTNHPGNTAATAGQ